MTARPKAWFRRASIALAAALSGIGHCAHADVILLSGAASGQASTATQVVEFNAQTNTVTFTLTNTSAITQPGSTSAITGIGFDLPPAGNASASGLNGFIGTQAPSASSTFTFSDGNLGGVPGMGNVILDFGFLTGIAFDAGLVALGLLPGESASFTVSGAAFTGFTEAVIAHSVFLFFQSVPTSGSDVGVPGTSSTPLPEPSSVLLAAAALAVLAYCSRRRRHGQLPSTPNQRTVGLKDCGP